MVDEQYERDGMSYAVTILILGAIFGGLIIGVICLLRGL